MLWRYFSIKYNVAILTTVFSMTACSHTAPQNYPQTYQNDDQQIALRQNILQNFSKWRGVRYRHGGSSHKGIDCSAFVQTIYYAALKRRLPRTTREQKYLGNAVAVSQLKVGDLVFFRRNHHVGIYIGNGEFIHASQKKGVTIASLNNPYFKKNYTQARHLL